MPRIIRQRNLAKPWQHKTMVAQECMTGQGSACRVHELFWCETCLAGSVPYRREAFGLQALATEQRPRQELLVLAKTNFKDGNLSRQR